MMIEKFATLALDADGQGQDALKYILRHDHTISIPTPVLESAEKVAVVSIAPRDTAEPVLVRVYRAIGLIVETLRHRAEGQRLDELTALWRDYQPSQPEAPKGGGAKVLQQIPKPMLPPGGMVADPF